MTTEKSDPYHLDRFVEAQAKDFDRVCTELSAGRKRTHWIWYVFPQMRGLGSSARSEFYGISSLDEARAYFSHPILGPRLVQVTRLVLLTTGKSLNDIFGSPDDEKFRSSMTLFAKVAGNEDIFEQALDTFCEGRPDQRTLDLIAAESSSGGDA